MKKESNEIIPKGYDEAFKILMKHYFEPFAKVITDYEIIKLPKKVDLMIIEAKEPITEHVEVFKYFKRFNIIEFKSEANRFRIEADLYKLGIYINGILLLEKEANIENTTFTLVTTLRPNKFLLQYNAEQKRQGLYKIDNISLLTIYIAVIEELELDTVNELKILKEFTSGKDREEYLSEVLKKINEGSEEYEEIISVALSLYVEEIESIIKKEGIEMTLVERNIQRWAEITGLKERYINDGIERGRKEGIERGIERGRKEGIERGVERGIERGIEKGVILTAKNALLKGLSHDDITDITGLTKKQIEKIAKELGKGN